MADGDEDQRDLTERRSSHAIAGSLGWDADAAWQPEHASLPGVGALLPTWQGIARTLAPIFHRVRVPIPAKLPCGVACTLTYIPYHLALQLNAAGTGYASNTTVYPCALRSCDARAFVKSLTEKGVHLQALTSHHDSMKPLPCDDVQGSSAFLLRAALLIHGPAGSGKATAVRAACMSMGLHLVPYGCAGLHAGNQSVAPSLRAAFQAAQHYAPGVLLLTDFEALAGSTAEAGSNAGTHRAASCLLVWLAAACDMRLPALLQVQRQCYRSLSDKLQQLSRFPACTLFDMATHQ